MTTVSQFSIPNRVFSRRSTSFLPAEGDKRDLKDVAFDIGLKDDGQAMSFTAVSHQPAFKISGKTHTKCR